MLDFHLDREADVTVAAIPVPVAEARAFGVLDVAADGEIRAFDEKPDEPRRDAGAAGLGAGVDGQLHLLDGAADRGAARRPGGRLEPRLRPQRAAGDGGQAAGVRVRLLEERDPRDARTRARLLARRRHHRRLLAGEHGPRVGQPDLRPVQHALAAPHVHAALAAGEVRVRRVAAHRHGDRFARVRRAASSRAGASTAASCRPGCASTASRTSSRPS